VVNLLFSFKITEGAAESKEALAQGAKDSRGEAASRFDCLSLHSALGILDSIFDGFVKSPSAALRFNPALLDKRPRIWE
jgi:hypothetical protein